MRQNKLSVSLRRVAAIAVLSMAPVVVAASSASALPIGQTVCYTSEGTPVFNPPSEDGYEDCFTRSGGSGGGTGLVLCTITATSYTCTPIEPLQG
jgi:hypothetical protein